MLMIIINFWWGHRFCSKSLTIIYVICSGALAVLAEWERSVLSDPLPDFCDRFSIDSNLAKNFLEDLSHQICLVG